MIFSGALLAQPADDLYAGRPVRLRSSPEDRFLVADFALSARLCHSDPFERLKRIKRQFRTSLVFENSRNVWRREERGFMIARHRAARNMRICGFATKNQHILHFLRFCFSSSSSSSSSQPSLLVFSTFILFAGQ